MADKPDSYKGSDPYIFISYARTDSEIVFAEIRRLQRMGYRVWYDDGIPGGSSYLEKIASAVEKCSCFLLFLSPAVVNKREDGSESFVLREIKMAVDFKRDIFPIMIVQTQLNNLIKGAIAGINYIEPSDQKYEKKLAESLPRECKSGNRSFVVSQPAYTPPPPSIQYSQEAAKKWMIAAFISIVLIVLAGGGYLVAKKGSYFSAAGPVIPEDMVLVPEGMFIRGASEKFIREFLEQYNVLTQKNLEFFNKNKKEEIMLPAFYIDKYEVSNQKYKNFVEKTNYPRPSHWKSDGEPFSSELANHPVVNVTYKDALAYCNFEKKRLPTFSEWEKAARGTDGRAYPWGNDYDKSKCNLSEAARHGTTAVDSHSAGVSPYGLYNMTGNVFEWTSSDSPEDEGYKITKGGSYDSDKFYGMTTFNFPAQIEVKRDYIGFRCARDAEPKK